jgi:hypothetical protein
MDRHIELTQFMADLRRHIADTELLIQASQDDETRQKNQQLLEQLLKKHEGAKDELSELLIAEHERLKKEPGPKLKGRERFDMHTRVRMELVFSKDQRAEAERLLHLLSTQRERFAAMRVSGGDLEKLKKAIELGRSDFRDLLMDAGFANHHEQHQRWWPGQPMTFLPP